MLNKLRNKEGFTLIELLIVVAIIGILAAIAIPQFSAYRIRGYNSSAVSDLNNIKLAENGFNQDSGGVFASNKAAGVAGDGTIEFGPLNQDITVAAASIGTFPNVATHFKYGLSNGVGLLINTTATTAAEFTIYTAHTQGNDIYGFDSDTTANRKWAAGKPVGEVLGGATLAAPPSSTTNTDDLAAATWKTI